LLALLLLLYEERTAALYCEGEGEKEASEEEPKVAGEILSSVNQISNYNFNRIFLSPSLFSLSARASRSFSFVLHLSK